MKRLILILLLCLLLPSSLSFGEDLYETQLNSGIRNSEPYSYLLIRESEANKTQAKKILNEAIRYSPDLPAAYFALAKASFNYKPEGVFETVDNVIQGISAYQRNFWWSFMMISSLFTSLLLSFIFSIIIIIMIRLPRDIPLFAHDMQEDKTTALSLLVLTLAIFGPLYFLGAVLIIISFYMGKWDRLILYFYIVFLLISPLVFNAVSIIFTAPVSGELKAIVQVNESKDNRYALSLLKGKTNPVERFSYALALKREGRYNEAIDIYNKLLALKPDPRTYNNLANCYIALNDINKAKELYGKALERKQMPSVLYNLSQAYRYTLDFDKGEEYFLSAQKMDPHAVYRFRSIAGRNPNRSVIDEGLPLTALMEYAKRTTTSTSTLGLVTVPPLLMPIIAILAAIFFYILNHRFKNRAYKCRRCGAILCNKCEKHILWGSMCLQCYQSLIKLDELDAKERIAKIITVYDYQKKRRNILKLISFIMPGGGHIYAGNILQGLVFLWPFLFFFFVPITNSIFIIDVSSFSHLWLNMLSFSLMFMVYILSNFITRRRILKGWL